MNTNIRQEKPADYPAVFELIEEAFRNLEVSNHQEQFFVERLRKSEAFIPELSLVALLENKIVGHIVLSKIKIKNDEKEFQTLILAPVSVLPEFQNWGIGSQLIKAAHQKALELGFKSVILVGHKDYYPRFGYKKAVEFGIKQPFDVPEENNLVIELVEDGLNEITGIVEYPKYFFE
ncbi:MAG TPA: N-acetyltransferase [Paludibacter sp.]